jgi:hypothetical protein
MGQGSGRVRGVGQPHPCLRWRGAASATRGRGRAAARGRSAASASPHVKGPAGVRELEKVAWMGGGQGVGMAGMCVSPSASPPPCRGGAALTRHELGSRRGLFAERLVPQRLGRGHGDVGDVEPHRQRRAGLGGRQHIIPAAAAGHEDAAPGGGRRAAGQQAQQHGRARARVEALAGLEAGVPYLGAAGRGGGGSAVGAARGRARLARRAAPTRTPCSPHPPLRAAPPATPAPSRAWCQRSL